MGNNMSMEELIKYLKTLNPDDKGDFCRRCGTTLGYIRKASSVKQRLGESLCINIERESGGAVKCEQLRPDVDWAYIRGTDKAVA